MPRARRKGGSLVIIGGHEDKGPAATILRLIHDRVADGRLLIVTSASDVRDELFDDYRKAFEAIGKIDLVHVGLGDRASALEGTFEDILPRATGAFFTGGDQLRLITRLEGTPLMKGIREILGRGGVIAGTSAGASAMSETMLVAGDDDEARAGNGADMAPGFGLFKDAIIDQHFAQRGRIGRLLSAVATNPRLLGVGIDEDTAIVVTGTTLRVIGAGAVYIADGAASTFTNVDDQARGRVVSLFDLRLHVLSAGDEFDLASRTPTAGEPEDDEILTEEEEEEEEKKDEK